MKSITFPVAALLACAPATFAQASFVEDFENVGTVLPGELGPQSLIDRGWEFRNQSEPVAARGYLVGTLFTPFEGSGYLAVDSSNTSFFGGDVSSWALLPEVPGQVAGDLVTLHDQRVATTNADLLQIRYSPSGGTDTGSSSTDVGDFTVLLAESAPAVGGWEMLSVSLPGDGRIALRYVVDNACNFGCGSSHVGIDLVSVGVPPAPACNLPPVPGAGQTVVWTQAGSPWQICADLAIPAGGTVVVEPGASITFDPGRSLTVHGSLTALGTALEPIQLSKTGSAPALFVGGLARLAFLDVQAQLHVLHGGSLIVEDSSFAGAGLGTDDSVGGQDHGTYVQIERCTLSGGSLTVVDGTLAVRETDLLNGGISVLRGYLFLADVSIDGAGLTFIRERFTQPTYLNDLSILNSPGPALDLQGWNFLIGQNTTLQNNLLPVDLLGGLLPGSVVPATGNLLNYVDVGSGGIVGNAIWAALPVPYVVAGFGSVGGASLLVEAGATVQFQPSAALIYFGQSVFRARGRAGQPVTFQAVDPLQGWNRLKFQAHSGTAHFEHCIFEDAQVALQSDNADLSVDASIFRNNQNGLWTNSGGLLTTRGTQFLNNVVGGHEESGNLDFDGSSSPNSFAGNVLGVEGGNGNATRNWWGSETGPTHPSNPGGTGDVATSSVQVLPFLGTAPTYSDAPPRVTLARPYVLMETGASALLQWEVEDDSSVASQRILFSEHGRNGFTPLVANLPGDARTLEITVPLAPPSSITSGSYFRVIAVDDAGQEGWDEAAVSIPYTEDLGPASLIFLTDLSQGFTYGDVVDVAWTQTGMIGTFNCNVVVDADGAGVPYGGGTTLTETWSVRMPYVSTDSARISLSFLLGAGGRTRTFYSDPFTIRPDARLPDAPPAISLLAPPAGASFTGGGCVQVAWAASDDEGLRNIRIQASYDDGRTWHPVVELAGHATRYAWHLPASTGIPDVLLRVIAVDQNYQNSSDVVPIAIQAGANGRCRTWRSRVPSRLRGG